MFNKALLVALTIAFVASSPSYAQKVPVSNSAKKPVITRHYIQRHRAARDAFKNSELERAKSLYEGLLRDYPNDSIAHCNLGLVLGKMGKQEEGIVHLKKAIAIRPNRINPYKGLALVYLSMGKTKMSLDMFKEMARRFPKDKKIKETKAAIAQLTEELERLKAGSGSPDAPDYFDYAIARGVLKWKPGEIPIKIYIKPASGVEGYRPSFSEFVRQGFSDWNEALGGKLKFEFVDTKDDAVVTCQFTDDVKKLRNIAEGGDAFIYPGLEGIDHARITLLTKNPRLLKLTDSIMRVLCLHEIGHTLGIVGHSINPKDIMYNSTFAGMEAPGLSERDRATILKLYGDEVAYSPSWQYLYANAHKLLLAREIDKAIPLLEKAKEQSKNDQNVVDLLAAACGMKAQGFIKVKDVDNAEIWLKRAYELPAKQKLRDQAKKALDAISEYRSKTDRTANQNEVETNQEANREQNPESNSEPAPQPQAY